MKFFILLRYKPVLYSLLLCLAIMTLTGCWNSRELNQLSIVSVVGIDKANEDIVMTTQVIIPKKMADKSGGKASEDTSYENFTVVSDTIFNAIRKTTRMSQNKLFHQHNKALLFSESISEEGLLKYIDMFLRDHEIRPEINIIVVEDEISEILNVYTKSESVPGFYIAELLENTKATSKIGVINIKDFFSKIVSEGIEPYASITKKSENEESLNLCGTAIFKNDKLVGKMSGEESRGLLWVLGEVKSGIIVVDCPNDKGKISLESIRSDSKIEVKKAGKQLSVTVKINETGNLGEQMCPLNDFSPEVKNQLVNRKNEAIKKEIEMAIIKAQKCNSDVFGFGQAIYKKYPKYWKEIKDQWDEIFPNLKVNIEVDTQIKRSGTLTKWSFPE